MKIYKKGYRFIIIKLTTIFFFTCLYWFVEHYVEEEPVKKAPFYDCLFYSFITQTTVGYGVPESISDSKSDLIKIINIFQMISIFIIIAIHL